MARSRHDEVGRGPRHTAQRGRHGRARIDTRAASALVFHLRRSADPPELDGVGQGEAARRHRRLPLPRPEAHLGLVARAERHFIAGADGTGRLEVVRDGAALCAPGAGETELRRRTHRAATRSGSYGHATGRKRSSERYVFATFGALSSAMRSKYLIEWRARRDSNSRP